MFRTYFYHLPPVTNKHSKRNSHIGQGCSSTYMVARLSNKMVILGVKCIFSVFCTKMTFCWTVWQPCRLSYILVLYVSFFYLSKDHVLRFWWKNIKNRWIWKIDFFWNNQIPLFKIWKKIIIFLSFLLKCLKNSLVA